MCGFLNTSTGVNALVFRIIFRIYCKSFFIYVVIKESNINKKSKGKAKGGILVVRISEKLPGLLKLENLNSNRAEEID